MNILFISFRSMFRHRKKFYWGPPSLLYYPGALSLGVKRQERKADHSPPSSAEVNE